MGAENIRPRELWSQPVVRIGLNGLAVAGRPKLSDFSGAVSICALTDASVDMTLALGIDGVVHIQAAGIDLHVRTQGGTPLESVFHVLLSPSFAPGMIGVDWEDICSLLKTGRKGYLITVELDDACSLESLVTSLVVAETNSIIGCCYLPESRFFSNSVDVLNRLIKGIESITVNFVIGAPIVASDKPTISLLLIAD